MRDFWDMTPVETHMAIEAYVWREEHRQKRETALAWRTAAFTRAKRLPPLKQLLSGGPAKPLRGPELQKRRSEFNSMLQAANRSILGKKLKRTE